MLNTCSNIPLNFFKLLQVFICAFIGHKVLKRDGNKITMLESYESVKTKLNNY